MRSILRNLCLAAIVLSVFLTLVACSSTGKDRIKVMTSTSLIANIVQRIGGDEVEVINLIPGSQHPGDFSVKPGDIEKLAKAKILFLHGEGFPGEAFADKMISAANNPNLIVFKADVAGNWMVPSVQLAATQKIATELEKDDPANASSYRDAADRYMKAINAKEAELKNKLAKVNLSAVNVISFEKQAAFLKWAGLNVVATYSDPKALTPQVVKDLVDKGKAANVTLIVDNLQNGKDAGKAIAEEIKAKQVNLSNFPGGFDNTETWEKAIEYNVNLIIMAIGK